MVRENSYKESMKFVKSLNEEAANKEMTRIQEKVDKIEAWKKQYHNILHDRVQRERFHGRLLESCRNDSLASAIKAIYITALENYCGLSDDETALAESIVENWVVESGGTEVILSAKNQHRSYLLARLAQIVEDAAKTAVMEVEAIEEADDDTEEDENKDDNSKQKIEDKKEDEQEDTKEEEKAEEEHPEDDDEEEVDYGDGEVEDGDFPDEDLDKDTDNDDEEDEEEPAEEDEEDYSDEININIEDDDEEDGEEVEVTDTEESDGEEEKTEEKVDVKDTEDGEEVEVTDTEETNGEEEDVTPEEEEKAGEEILDDDPNEDEDDTDVTDTENDTYEDSEEEDGVDSDKLYKDLEDEEDVKKAVDTIQTRVADAEEKFIKKNAEDKKKVDELLHKINNSVKTVEEIDDDENPKSQAEQEHVMMYKRQISDIANKAPKSVFEAMANEISKSTYLAESAKAAITDRVTEDVDTSPEAIIGKTRILYGFLETLNTLRLEDVNENYIKKVIEEIN